MTLIPLDTAFFTAGATASESTGFTINTPTFLEIKSSMSLVCFAASSPASTTIRFPPSSSALALAPSARDTKNGLFRVETEKPMAFPPFAEPSEVSSPSIVIALQPARPAAKAMAAANTAHFLRNVNLFMSSSPYLFLSDNTATRITRPLITS